MNDDVWTLLTGLLGPTPEQLAELRTKYGVADAEVPSIPARIGRGLMDVWEPMKQSYLNVADPTAANAYKQQRTEDERLYERGLLAGNPEAAQPTQVATMPNGEPLRMEPPSLLDTDMWRMVGRTSPLGLATMFAPAMPAAEIVLGMSMTAKLYESLEALRQKLGLAPWFETPQFWR
jgi:hypothetical protein